MKKLITVFIAVIALMILLIVMAFLYIDMSGHEGFRYDMFKGKDLVGHVKIEKYVTEGKIVYKETITYPDTLEWPEVNRKLLMERRTMTPVRFVEKTSGVKGQKRVMLLVREDEETDFLFVEHPRFITLKDLFPEKDFMIFIPDDIMLYMTIVKKYNFWKKGPQVFDVFVPFDGTAPPILEKMEVRYLKDEYIPVMGKRVEADIVVIRARMLPEIKIFLSKYTHRILALEVGRDNVKFILTSFIETPGKRIEHLLDKAVSVLDLRRIKELFGISEEKAVEGKQPESDGKIKDADPVLEYEEDEEGTSQQKEVFFESDSLILSGKLRVPVGEGPFPIVIIVPGDGPRTRGEQIMCDSYAAVLAESGFAVMTFDERGQGKSQGEFSDIDDEKRIQDIVAAVHSLEKYPEIDRSSVNLIGYEGGGYIAVRAAASMDSVRSCIFLGMPYSCSKDDFLSKAIDKDIQTALEGRFFGNSDKVLVEDMTKKEKKYLEGIVRSSEDFSFLRGVKLPLKQYREFLKRNPCQEIISSEKPVLLVLSKNDKYFSQQVLSDIRKELKEKGRDDKVEVLRDPEMYMGEMTVTDGGRIFSIDKQMMQIVVEWLDEHGIYIEPESPVEIEIEEVGAVDVLTEE